MKEFLAKNKIFLLGLLSSIAVVLEQFNEATPDYKAVGLAVLLAVLSFISREWRGQGITVLGIVGILAGIFVNSYTGGTALNWIQIIGASLGAILAAVSPAAKPLSYEKDPVIEAAKGE